MNPPRIGTTPNHPSIRAAGTAWAPPSDATAPASGARGSAGRAWRGKAIRCLSMCEPEIDLRAPPADEVGERPARAAGERPAEGAVAGAEEEVGELRAA